METFLFSYAIGYVVTVCVIMIPFSLYEELP